MQQQKQQNQQQKQQQQQEERQQQQQQQRQQVQREETSKPKVALSGQASSSQQLQQLQHHHHIHNHHGFFHPNNTGNKSKETATPHEGVLRSTSQPGVSIEQLFEDPYTLPVTQHGASGSSTTYPPSASTATATTTHGGYGHLDYVTSGYSQDGLGINGCSTLPSSRVVAAQRRLAKMSVTVSTTVTSKNPSSSIAASSVSSTSSLDPHFLLRKRASSIPSLTSATTAFSSSSYQRARSSDVTTTARALMSRSARAVAGNRGSGSGSRSAGGARGAGGGEAFVPVSGASASKEHASYLTEREKAEVKAFKTVYYLGQLSSKMAAREEAEKNEGFDDKDGFYVCKNHDHLLFRYEIQDLLGKGTFGQVVKAWDHKTNSLVALKIVKNEKPFLKQAKEEVRILEVLKKQDRNENQNLVHILDSFKFRGHVCIAFELLGISLHQLLKKTRGQGFSLSRTQKLTRGILRCLDLLAKNRLIHCDIKPENILLRRSAPGVSASSGAAFSDSSIKVIDFGSSCYEQQQIYTYIQSRYYRAPEVILGARYSSAIDMWSLACVIGELLTAQPLFAGDDEHDQLASIMEVRGTPPVSLMGRCKRWDKFFSGDTPRYLNGHGKAGRRGAPMSMTLSSALKDTEDAVFLDFMQKALTWDPGSRLSAAEALQHAWILRGQGSKTMSTSEAKGSPGSGHVDTSKTKIQDKTARQDSLLGLRRLSGATTASSSGISSKTASGSGHSTVTNTSAGGSGSQSGAGSLKNNALTAKLPSHLVRPRNDSAALAQKALAGPAIALPPWDAR